MDAAFHRSPGTLWNRPGALTIDYLATYRGRTLRVIDYLETCRRSKWHPMDHLALCWHSVMDHLALCSDDGPELREASLMAGVKQIQAPVLFAWGGQDDRIDPADGHRFVEAVQRKGKVHRALFKADEGHGFESRPNVEELFGAVESFLAEHLKTGGR